MQHPEQHPRSNTWATSFAPGTLLTPSHCWRHPSVTTIFAPQVPLYEKVRNPVDESYLMRNSSRKRKLECYLLVQYVLVLPKLWCQSKMWAWKPEASFQIKLKLACYSCSTNRSLEDMTMAMERGHQVLCSWPNFQVLTWIGYFHL